MFPLTENDVKEIEAVKDFLLTEHTTAPVSYTHLFSFETNGHPYIEIKASYSEAVVHEFGHFVDAICKYRFNRCV